MENIFCNNIEKYIKIANYNFLNNLPFSQFYKNIEYTNINKYHIFYEKETINLCKVNDEQKYKKYLNNKYECNINVLYYEREYKELEYMLKDNNYYDYFTYGNIITDKSYNPTVYHSLSCGNFVLSPTISPYKNDHIVFISYDKNNNQRINKAVDIYQDIKLIEQMFHIFKILIEINRTYVLINNIETGSLQEVYHFHIFTNNFILDFNDIKKKKLIINDFYEIEKHEVFSNMYILLDINNDKIKMIFDLINKIRNTVIDKYVFIPQLYFLQIRIKLKLTKCLIISFKKIKYDNLKIENNNFIQQYYDELFLDKKHKLYYYPYGIIHLAKSIDNFNLDNKLIEEMQSFFHLIVNINQYIENNNNNNDIIIKSNIGYSYYLNELLLKTLDKNFNYETIFSDNRTENMPILYKLEDIIIDKVSYENGILDLIQSRFYYIKVSENDYKNFDLILKNLYNNIRIFLPYYYCNIKIRKYYYYIFENIRTTLDVFLKLDEKNLNNDRNLLDYFVLKMSLMDQELKKLNININVNLNNFIVTYNKNEYEEYELNNTIYNADRFNYNNEIKLHNYNCDIKLNLNVILNNNNNSNFSNIITELSNNNNINNYKKNNIYFNKSDYYETSKLLEIICGNPDLNNIYDYILNMKNQKKLSAIINNNKLTIIIINDIIIYDLIDHEKICKLDEYKVYGNPKKQYYYRKYDEVDNNYLLSIVGNEIENDKKNIIYFPENKINTIQEPKYFILLKDLRNIDNVQNSLDNYTKKNLTSRYNLYKINDINNKKIINNGIFKKLNDLKNIYLIFINKLYEKKNIDLNEIKDTNKNLKTDVIQTLYHIIIKNIINIFDLNQVIGNTTNIKDDFVREIVYFEPEKHTKLISSIFINGFEKKFIFKDNIEDINNYIYDIKNEKKYNDQEIVDISNGICDNLYDIIKERFVKREYKYDVYTLPNIINIEEYYKNYNYKNIFGGNNDKYKYKYIKYKYKYLMLKNYTM